MSWIVCEEGDTTLFEGRHQGRTRGSALKFLKEQIGRKSLSGVVFTITEIPVPLIREIVAEVLAGGHVTPLTRPESAPMRSNLTTRARRRGSGEGDARQARPRRQ